MRRNVFILIACLCLSIITSALADTSLSEMASEELALLRDAINQELNSREENMSSFIIDNDLYAIAFTGVEEADHEGVNDYYDRFDPMYGSSFEGNSLIVLFTFTNKSDEEASCSLIRDKSSINGWMISAYAGIRKIDQLKKAKGFINAHLEDCDANSIDEVESFSFTFDIRQGDAKDTVTVTIIKTENGWIFE